jgi:hypothetical protein
MSVTWNGNLKLMVLIIICGRRRAGGCISRGKRCVGSVLQAKKGTG